MRVENLLYQTYSPEAQYLVSTYIQDAGKLCKSCPVQVGSSSGFVTFTTILSQRLASRECCGRASGMIGYSMRKVVMRSAVGSLQAPAFAVPLPCASLAI